MFNTEEITLERHREWFSNSSIDNLKHLLIYENGGNRLGFVGLETCRHSKIAEWGFYTDPFAPRGTGKSLGICALKYTFCEIGIQKIIGKVLSTNELSINFHKRLGFIQEGILRSSHYDGKKYYDVVYFGLTLDEWEINNEKFIK